jgi:hypothetical protein
MNSSRPEPRGERSSEIMEGEIVKPRFVHSLFEYDPSWQ